MCAASFLPTQPLAWPRCPWCLPAPCPHDRCSSGTTRAHAVRATLPLSPWARQGRRGLLHKHPLAFLLPAAALPVVVNGRQLDEMPSCVCKRVTNLPPSILSMWQFHALTLPRETALHSWSNATVPGAQLFSRRIRFSPGCAHWSSCPPPTVQLSLTLAQREARVTWSPIPACLFTKTMKTAFWKDLEAGASASRNALEAPGAALPRG
ncbi:uncharacterized protein LOC122202248 [Panthera leo]|uniref:uncharacterized protein LOC122202248 n=1 Tax=Panthera leo TaxID=9689 RepID=UPI001C69AD47|nr:uncharacterized protein LOC122202248 [Panthera leo]